MGIIELKKRYRNGELQKPDFIVQMHECHKSLFEYAELIRTTDIQKIEISDGRVVTTSREHGIKMLCDSHDRRIAPIETLNFGAYEKEDGDMMLQLIDDGQKVFDIGGNFGWYSLVIAKTKKVKVFTFEPVPRTYGYLRQNVDLNELKNIELFNFGFSDKEEELKFYYYPEGSGNASIANLSDGDSVQSVICKVKKLDDFVRDEGVSIDFIKCDVEGAELLVFKGGMDTIQSCKPIIFAELLRKWAAKFGYHPNQVIKLLTDCGYRCFSAAGEKLMEIFFIDDQTVETNFFFLHKEKHKEKITNLLFVS